MRKRIVDAWRVLRGELVAVEPFKPSMWIYDATNMTTSSGAKVTWMNVPPLTGGR